MAGEGRGGRARVPKEEERNRKAEDMQLLVRKLEGQRAGFYDPSRNSAMEILWLFGTSHDHDHPMQCAITGIILIINPKKASRYSSYLLDLSGLVSLGESRSLV